MKLRITASDITDPEELRTLLIDAADELAGAGCRILEPQLSWDGHPILLADAGLHPVLVSFDVAHGQAALLNGLKNAEQLAGTLAWVNQVYDFLQQQQRAPKLIVVSRELPPGATAILSACPNLSLFRYRILNVNGETGLWLERMSGDNAPLKAESVPAPAPAAAPPARPFVVAATAATDNDTLPSLSDEENAYFQQL
ncbi:MAG: hypothetical protein J5I92_07535 [Thiogranum sp.]|nr:hypothetical protein [Thiogranum sp.]